MKILVLSNYFPPYYIGGYELACFDTVNYLKNAGHDVVVLTGDYQETSLEYQEVYRKLKYIDYDNASYGNKHAVETFNYKVTQDILTHVQPDLVYVWSLRLISLSPLWAVEELNIKKVFEIGDFWMKGFLSPSYFSQLKRKIKEYLPFFNSRNVHINPVITVSEWMKEEMKELYGSKKIYHIPNGTVITPKKYNKKRTLMQYMFCGRIDHSKGLDLAIKALGNLKDMNIHDFQLQIYGDGDPLYISKCKKMVHLLNLDKNVFFHNKVNDLTDAYKKSHVLLMPTRMREPFGLVLIEAMNHGVVSIATNDYGPTEIIDNKKDGLLFKPLCVKSLTKNILLLHNNWELLKKYRQNAYKKVATKFDIDLVKKDVESVLLAIVREQDE